MSDADMPAQVAPGTSPVLLLAASTWWPAAARLAVAFIEHGCRVVAFCPPGHPLRYVRGVHEIHTCRALGPRRSLQGAIRRVQPDLVVPCDDRCVAQLHELHRLQPLLRPLIERSLGDPFAFGVVESRDELLDVAQQLGVRVAHTCAVASSTQAAAHYARGAATSLLKTDGTGGGRGVVIVRSAAQAAAAFRRIRFGTGIAVALKRLLINRDPLALWSWSRRRQAAVTLQEFVDGTPANIMVACWRGKVLAELSVQALACQGPTGASLVVRVIKDRQLSRAAALLAAHLRISGFFGLDFILEQDSGAAYLIEMNPRCTQLGHLKLPQGDLAGALCAALRGTERARPRPVIRSDTIALFPQAWLWGAPGAFREGVHHDVPWEEQRLVEALVRTPWPERQWLARCYHLFRRPAALRAVETAPIDALIAGAAVESAIEHAPRERGMRSTHSQ
jgi:hypothetical protein